MAARIMFLVAYVVFWAAFPFALYGIINAEGFTFMTWVHGFVVLAAIEQVSVAAIGRKNALDEA